MIIFLKAERLFTVIFKALSNSPDPEAAKHTHNTTLPPPYWTIQCFFFFALFSFCARTPVFQTVQLLTHQSVEHSPKRLDGHLGLLTSLTVLQGQLWFSLCHSPMDAFSVQPRLHSGVMITDLCWGERCLQFIGCFSWIFSDLLGSVVLDTNKNTISYCGRGVEYFFPALQIVSFLQNVLINSCVCIWSLLGVFRGNTNCRAVF